MSYPHAIRLHGPWQLDVTEPRRGASASPTARSFTVRPPCDWDRELGRDFRGRVRYTRGFNRPTNLDPHEHVWLVVEGADARAEYFMNDRPLGKTNGYALHFECDATENLESRNQLAIDVELPAVEATEEALLRPGRVGWPGGLIGDVRLEIRAEHYLDRLSVETWEQADDEVRLRLTGRVAGPARREKLLVVANGWSGELLAGEVAAREAFELVGEIERLSRHVPHAADGLGGLASVSIRLIDGGTRVWERTLETAHRRTQWLAVENAAAPQLVVDGARIELPLEPFGTAWSDLNEAIAARSKTLAGSEDGLPPLMAAERIFADAEYSLFDRAGLRLVQVVPPEWAEEVCARLAHHPSIVAWSAPGAWLKTLAPMCSILGCAGVGARPWIQRELVLVDP